MANGRKCTRVCTHWFIDFNYFNGDLLKMNVERPKSTHTQTHHTNTHDIVNRLKRTPHETHSINSNNMYLEKEKKKQVANFSRMFELKQTALMSFDPVRFQFKIYAITFSCKIISYKW